MARGVRFYSTDTDVKAFGVCGKCSGAKFRIAVREGGVWEPWCNRCGETWTSSNWLVKNDSSATLEGNGDVAGDVVSAAEGKAG